MPVPVVPVPYQMVQLRCTVPTTSVGIRIHYVFGPPGSESGYGSVSQRYGSRSLYPSSKKKDLDSYCFVTSLWPFILEKWCKCNVPSKRNKQKNFRIQIHWSEARIRESGSVPKCHGSTQQCLQKIKFLETGPTTRTSYTVEIIFFFYNCFTFLIHAELATVPVQPYNWVWIRIQDPRSGTRIRIRTKLEFESATHPKE